MDSINYGLSGAIVVVAGSAGSLGSAVAQKFISEGAHVAPIDLDMDRVRKQFSDLETTGGYVVTQSVDSTDPNSLNEALQSIVDHYGRIDVLANTVGGFRMGTPVHELSLEDWDFMLDINAKSMLLTCRAILPTMLAQGWGRIINVAARSGLAGYGWMAPYSVSKSAVIRLTESIAEEVKDKGINVNCVMPGTIDTPQNRIDMPKANHSTWVPPQQIAEVIAFLGSKGANAINGAAIPVYGLS